jgi:hypothetical protein
MRKDPDIGREIERIVIEPLEVPVETPAPPAPVEEPVPA